MTTTTMKHKITNLVELQVEIARLQTVKTEQEAYLQHQFGILKEKATKPVRFFQNMFSFLPSSSGLFNNIGGAKGGAGLHEDWLTRGLKIGLPFLVNRVFFRKAGYVKKILMGLLSTQAAGFLNKERLAGIVNSVTSLIKKTPKKKGTRGATVTAAPLNYGIPPDSETY